MKSLEIVLTRARMCQTRESQEYVRDSSRTLGT